LTRACRAAPELENAEQENMELENTKQEDLA